jgi:hypothetical protein
LRSFSARRLRDDGAPRIPCTDTPPRQILPDALPIPPVPKWIKFLMMGLYFIFPIVDIAIRVVLHFEIELK